ncbi:hypothetical protein F3J37_01060 [Pantoea sp. Al-1710]|uniref:Protein TonB n=1 Tax=Candidatus Pantoea communis TaxID=2608354 RepID=A0ABX0RHY6_9GAMM|nr:MULTISPECIES: energy transducer TonB [Pantoea]NIG13034.1 hypothetical protein [Pantoea sp. Cy-640]NIG17265.1 hypothetical protein [Pantoea communis]
MSQLRFIVFKKIMLILVLMMSGCSSMYSHKKPGTYTYPSRAWALNVDGDVSVSFDVDSRGKTENIHILSEHPEYLFSRGVINDVSEWKFPAGHPQHHLIYHASFRKPGIKYTN